jgi:tricarballylate dehydrogenase
MAEFDVIVVGAGNAATCAALSAREAGAEVLMLEISPEEMRGGNSCFTGGAFRVVYHGGEDLAQLIPDMNETELKDVDFGTYTEEEYFDDMGRVTQYRCDPDLTEILIRQSFATAVWMREKGVRFQLGLGRQAFRVDGKFKFWGGLACHIWGGGKEDRRRGERGLSQELDAKSIAEVGLGAVSLVCSSSCEPLISA